MEGGVAAMEGPAPMEGGAAAMEGPAPMDGRSEIGDGPLSSGDGTRPTGKMLTGFIAQMWLWIAAHTVFPLGILATLAIGRFKATPVVGTRLRHARIAVASASFVMIGVAALLTIAALHFQAQLPRIMQEGPPALPLNVIALPIALWLGWRSGKIERWALVALTASVADVVLTRIASEPFTLGWYGGRLLNVAAATVLLVALVAEISRLYGRLAVAHDRLSIQAAHDALTGALTRTAVLAEAEELLRRAREANRPTTLAILDVDHFKQINDVHGHLVGDRVLVALAERMGAGLREKDLLGRYGGEEFILLIRDASETTGRAIAARVQEHVRTEPIPTPSGGVHVTVSIGLTDLRPGDRSIEDVLERADGSLYAAKERGRDRIVYDFAPTAQLQPALARAPGSSLPRPA